MLGLREVLDECYAQLLDEGIPRLLANYPTAELVKVAANAFLATKISFINAVAEHDKDAKQFRNIALKHKKVVLAHIERLAAEMGATEPAVLAHQLALLIDGAIVAAMVSGDPGVADTAGLAAGNLFAPARAKKAKRASSAAELVAL